MDAMPYLLMITGPHPGEVWEVHPPKVILGRHPECAIPIEAADASRHHAQILAVGDDCFLEDLHSTNGTFLNERPIRGRQKIGDGDRIRISNLVFEFHGGCPAGAPASAGRGSSSTPCVLVDDEGPITGAVVLSQRSAAQNKDTDRSELSLQSELKALLQITQSLRNSLMLDAILPQILDALFLIFPAVDRGFIVLQEEDGALVPRWTKIREGDTPEKIQISRTIVAQVMEAQRAILSADAAYDPRFKNSDSLAVGPIHSLMCAPLVDSEGHSFGVLQVDATERTNRCQEEDLEVLLAVAIQASIAIENARLHEKSLQQRAVERDLELADRIQRRFLPQHPPELPGYRFFHYYRPAGHVGGDFYDYVFLPNGHLMVFVADVTGHGLAAAMLTAKLAAEIRYRLLVASRPAEVMRQLNTCLCRDLPEDHFVTMLAIDLTPATGETILVNAGHMLPLLRTGAGEVREIGMGEAGLPLGVADNTDYQETRLSLAPGGTLLLYTDGINEATNAAGQVYGREQLRKQVEAACGNAEEIAEHVLADVWHFVEVCVVKDDMCLVCLGRN